MIASLSAIQSPSAALNANEKGRLHGALSHGHRAHVGVRMDHEVMVLLARPTAAKSLTLPPVNWRGLRLASLSRIQIGRNLPLSRLRARAVTGCASLFHSRAGSRCTAALLQLLQDQHPQYRAVPVVNHHRRLSSSAAFAGFQPSEAAHGRVPKSSRAFHRKEGELPNVCG